MPNNHEPVILELAPLPREQVGPFILLGVPKTADQEQIEANWAQRVIWSRKKQIRVPLEDVNWAREVINDPERRVRADVTSLNVDTGDETLRRLAQRSGAAGARGAGWHPLDVEKNLAAYAPPTDLPDPAEVKSALRVPEVPREFPHVGRILEQFVQEPLDPWKLNLSLEPHKVSAE
jgi:hypothetical protein